VLTYIGLLIFHVKYPLLLAGIASTMSLVPIFGSILSSVRSSPSRSSRRARSISSRGSSCSGGIIGIHLVEANFLNPKIMGGRRQDPSRPRGVRAHRRRDSYGLVGALFAVPVASMIQTIFVYTAGAASPPRPLPRVADLLGLKRRLARDGPLVSRSLRGDRIPFAADGALTPPGIGQPSLATKTYDSTDRSGTNGSTAARGRLGSFAGLRPADGPERSLTPPLRESLSPCASSNSSNLLSSYKFFNFLNSSPA